MTVEWFVLFAVLLVIELLTVNLVTVWFAFGAVAAIICSFLLFLFHFVCFVDGKDIILP